MIWLLAIIDDKNCMNDTKTKQEGLNLIPKIEYYDRILA
jgi:hypothetical protein